MFDEAFNALAAGFSRQYGGPYVSATAVWPGMPTENTDGTIETPANPVSKSCKVQVSKPTSSMRQQEGFVETDMRLLVLAGSLDGILDSTAKVSIASGIHAGTWSLESVQFDSVGIGWDCRGRKVP